MWNNSIRRQKNDNRTLGPLKDVTVLQDRINRLFSESFGQTRDLDDDMRVCAWRPAVDIYEAENKIVLKAELPGINKDDVAVEVKDNALTLRGERFPDAVINEDKYYRREICFGTFERTFTLQDRIQPEQIKATFKNGILTVTIPRPQVESPKQITVDVE